MEISDKVNIGPIKIQESDMVGNWKTRLHEVEGGVYLVKVDMATPKLMPRLENESAEHYYDRRFKESMDFISRQREGSSVREFVPAEVKAPKEFHLIIDGYDGFPVPARIQEKFEGKMMKHIKRSDLSEENWKQLYSLLDAGIECYKATGKILDITGYSGKEEGLTLKGLVERALISTFNPLMGSSNLLHDKEKNIVFIDANTMFEGDEWYKKLTNFVQFSVLLTHKFVIETQKNLKKVKMPSLS